MIIEVEIADKRVMRKIINQKILARKLWNNLLNRMRMENILSYYSLGVNNNLLGQKTLKDKMFYCIMQLIYAKEKNKFFGYFDKFFDYSP